MTQLSTVNYSLRVDESDKRRAEQVFKALGMTFSTGINIYLKTVGRERRIPFDLAVNGQDVTAAKPSLAEKEQAFNALDSILAGYDVNLDQEREERILSK